CREAPPVNARFRRAIRLTGFEDATVILFPEDGCECAVSTAPKTDHTPEFDSRFRLIHDEVHGTYLKGEHISGSFYFLMGRKSETKRIQAIKLPRRLRMEAAEVFHTICGTA
nr:hypothetical protein [Clostridia bacterium]